VQVLVMVASLAMDVKAIGLAIHTHLIHLYLSGLISVDIKGFPFF